MSNPPDHTRLPRRIAACDAGKLSIGAIERFVLSNVDGKTSAKELADVTGVPPDDVGRILDQLVTLGAIELGSAPKTPSPRPPGPVPSSGKSTTTILPDDEVDLDPALKEQINTTFAKLDELDHYELLAVPRDADKKAIKNAYYSFAARFHTDRYFGKNLGGFKTKMEQIFGKVTMAHDTLAHKQRRAEYDEYTSERERTRAYEKLMAMIDGGGDVGAELRASPNKVAIVPPASAAMPSPPPPPREAASSPPRASPPPSPTSPEQERARREMLARRLSGARGGTGRSRATSITNSTLPTGAMPTAEETRAATDAIKRMYEDRRDGAKKAQAQRFVDAGNEALAKEDLVVAANHFRLAISYTDDAEVHRLYEETNRRARDVMAEAYLKQARYEEQNEKWKEAAHSYGKAIDGRPDDADIAERAANALRREGRDLHLAARYGELAVQKNPNNAPFRVTLGQVYLDAGLFLRARSELEQALKLDSSLTKAKELLAQAKRATS